MTTSIENRVALDLIRYANVWEDADILCEALRPGQGKRILSIASGGDNCFALLGEGAEVVAADLSPAQLACVELKRAALHALDDASLLRFLGIHSATDRRMVYRQLAGALPESARRFWDAQPQVIEAGIVHAGKFERYFQLFRTRVLPLIHSHQRIQLLLTEKSPETRREFYAATWNNWRWRCMFRFFFSRLVMGRLGRDPEFFRHVEGSVAERILSRAQYGLTELPTHSNPYLEYILTGNFSGTLPRYLRPQHINNVRRNLDLLQVAEGPIDEVGRLNCQAGFDGYNLSDIFEYLDSPTCEKLYAALLNSARPGARLAYWNMLAPRRCPPTLRGKVRALDEAQALFRKDLAFFYSAFVLEEVR